MPVDIQQSLTGATSFPISASTNHTGVDLGAGGAIPGAGTPKRGLVARIVLTDAHNASGSNTLTFTMEHSPDNSNWKTLAGASQAQSDDFTLSTTVQSKEVFIPFETMLRYIRLVATIGGAGTGVAVSYSAYLAPALP